MLNVCVWCEKKQRNKIKTKWCAICVKYCQILVPFKTKKKMFFWFKILIRTFIFLWFMRVFVREYWFECKKCLSNFSVSFFIVSYLRCNFGKVILCFNVRGKWPRNRSTHSGTSPRHALQKSTCSQKTWGKNVCRKKPTRCKQKCQKLQWTSENPHVQWASNFKKNINLRILYNWVLKMFPTKSQTLELHWKSNQNGSLLSIQWISWRKKQWAEWNFELHFSMEQKAMASILKWRFIESPYQATQASLKNMQIFENTRLDIKRAGSLFISDENNTIKKNWNRMQKIFWSKIKKPTSIFE